MIEGIADETPEPDRTQQRGYFHFSGTLAAMIALEPEADKRQPTNFRRFWFRERIHWASIADE